MIFIYGSAKKPGEKKSKEGERTLAELSSLGNSSPFANKMSVTVQNRYIKRINFFLFAPYNKQLINRA